MKPETAHTMSNLRRRGPQEWKWELQERGILSVENQATTHDLMVADDTIMRRIRALPENARIRKPHCWDSSVDLEVKNDSLSIDHHQIRHALEWLHVVTSRELPLVEASYRSREARYELLESREKIIETHIGTMQSRAMGNLGKSMDSNDTPAMPSDAELSSSSSECIPASRTQLQKMIRDEHAESLQEIFQYHKEVSERLNQPSTLRPFDHDEFLLQPTSDDDTAHDSSYERILLAADRLQELLAFVQSRRLELLKSTRSSIPPFLTWLVASEDVDALERYERELRSVLHELTVVHKPSLVRLSLMVPVEGSSENCAEGHSATIVQKKLERQCRDALQRHEELQKEVLDCQTELKVLHEDLAWCHNRIESLRVTLEHTINKTLILDGHDDEERRCTIHLPSM